MTTNLRTAQLVAAARQLQELFTIGFLHAEATITNLREDPMMEGDKVFEFRVQGFAHGTARAVLFDGEIKAICLKQFTSDVSQVSYTEFYESRHGNRELNYLLRPLVESKLLPVLTKLL